MSESISIPSDLKSCQSLIVAQQERIDDLQSEQEKLRKLLEQMIHGNRSEKRIFSGADQTLLPCAASRHTTSPPGLRQYRRSPSIVGVVRDPGCGPLSISLSVSLMWRWSI